MYIEYVHGIVFEMMSNLCSSLPMYYTITTISFKWIATAFCVLQMHVKGALN